MRRSSNVRFPLAFVLALHSAAAALESTTELSGRDIMDEVSRHHDSDAESESLAMVLTDRKGAETKRSLRQFSRKHDDGDHKYLLVFDEPKGIKGVALLTWEQQGGDDDQWVYLPAMGNKLKRIASGGRMNYFMGTDFAFEDLVAEELDSYHYERQPDAQVDDHAVYVVDAFPASAELMTGYEKRRLYVRQDIFVVVQIDFHQRRTGKLMKRLDIGKLEQTGGDQWRASERVMEHLLKRHKTRITTLERWFDAKLVPERLFTHRHLTSRSHMR